MVFPEMRKPRRILYVGFYDTSDNFAEARTSHLPATNKMDYICRAINATGRDVLIVSPSRTSNRRTYPGRVSVLAGGVSLRLFRTLPWGNRIQRAVSIVAGHTLLFLFLVCNTRKHEPIIVYHSLSLMRAVLLAKRIRGFKMLLEVEEVYQHVVEVSPSTARDESAAFRLADAYMFSTELLNGSINTGLKPYVVIYGTYQVEPDRGVRRSDGRVHVVYAGIIGSQKGAALAASTAAHLDGGYHVHIAGFGDEREIQGLKDQIARIGPVTECGLTYDGLFKGSDFLDFLQACDIGLSTQMPGARFNDTSFPSKILTYLANGLAVVSVRIRAVEQSRVASDIIFYDGDEPEAVAGAIRSIRFPSARDGRELIERFNTEFVAELSAVLNELKPE